MNFIEKIHHALNKITDPILNNTHKIKFGVKMTWLVIKGLIVIIITIWWFNFLSNNS